jgi:hypothetical protein
MKALKYKSLIILLAIVITTGLSAESLFAQRGGRGSSGGGRSSGGGGSSMGSRGSMGGGRSSMGGGRSSIGIARPSTGNRSATINRGSSFGRNGNNSINRSSARRGLSNNGIRRGSNVRYGSNRNSYARSRYNNYRPGYGRRYGSGYRGYGGYGYRGSFYNFYRPYIGLSIGILPFGYYPFYYGANQFYYSSGMFYQQKDERYTVVIPPVGAEVPKLPADASEVVINGETFFEYKGIYYSEKVNAEGKTVYVVAGKDGVLNTDSTIDTGPAVGEIVDQLPEGSREILLKDQRYFVAPDGTYYEEVVEGNTVTYKVSGKSV